MKHSGRTSFIVAGLLAICMQFMISEFTVAQSVITLIEDGNQVEMPNALLQKLESGDDNPVAQLQSWYFENGYLAANVRQIRSNYFGVEKGCRFSFGEISVDPEEFESFLPDVAGYYEQNKIKSLIGGLMEALEEEGYLFSNVFINEFMPNMASCTADISLRIESGDMNYSGEVLFPGADVNQPVYLKRISGARDSVLITSLYLQGLRSNLLQSELLTEVGQPEVYLNEGEEPVIVIPVEERSLNQFDGLLGYVPDQSGQGQIVGDFELSLWNVLNQGNGLDLMFERLRPETTRLRIGVSQDWIGSIPIGIGLNFNLFQNDTTYQSRRLMLESYHLVGRGLKLTGDIGQVGSTSGTDLSSQIEPDGRKRLAELGFEYSNLDNPEVPTSGLRLGAGFGVANKSVDIDSVGTFSQQYLTASGELFAPFRNRSVVAFRARGYLLNADKITDSDMMRFGGARSLRGYSEEQFRGAQVLWGDVEYRYLLNRSSYLFAFGAAGYYQRPQLLTESDNSFRNSDTLFSTGFGISYKIRIGRLKFTYAISPQENLGNGKVHVGIVTRL
jgi:outer membrane protein assembly factor BamA